MGFFIFIGFFWGFNEGLWFFIIPDIILSFAALKGWRPAIYTTLATVFGSMLAAVTIYLTLAHFPPETFTAIWSSLPGYYPKMLDTVNSHLTADGVKGLLNGPTSGIPYRFYALQAYAQNIGLLDLLIWTPLARLQRVVLAPIAVLIIKWLLDLLAKKLPIQKRKYLKQESINKWLFVIISLYWVYIYIWYWGTFLPTTYK